MTGYKTAVQRLEATNARLDNRLHLGYAGKVRVASAAVFLHRHGVHLLFGPSWIQTNEPHAGVTAPRSQRAKTAFSITDRLMTVGTSLRAFRGASNLPGGGFQRRVASVTQYRLVVVCLSE